jgi:hypothetical protein
MIGNAKKDKKRKGLKNPFLL